MELNKKKLSHDEKVKIIKEYGGSREHILRILLAIKKANVYKEIDSESIQLVSEITGIKITRILEMIHFYAMLNDDAEADYVIKICKCNPCQHGKEDIAKELSFLLNINVGETTADGRFSLQYMPCVGACDIGPVIQINDELYGDLTKEKLEKIITCLKYDTSYQEEVE